MEYRLQFQKLCRVETRRLLFVMGIIVVIVLLFQSLMLPYGNVFLSVFHDDKVAKPGKSSFVMRHSSPKPAMVGNFSLFNALTDSSVNLGVVKNNDASDVKKDDDNDNDTKGKARDPENDSTLEKDRGPDDAFELDEDRNPDEDSSFEEVVELDMNSKLKNVKDLENGSPLEMGREEHSLSLEQITKSDNDFSVDSIQKAHTSLTLEKIGSANTAAASSSLSLPPVPSLINATFIENSELNSNISTISVASKISTVGKQATEMLSKDENSGVFQIGPAISNNNPMMTNNPVRKKMRSEMPPKSVTSIFEMNRLLLRNRASYRSMRPRWSSVRDQELVSAKAQIENAPTVKSDRELYAPLFRNVSMFKRSYELMERILKVYIYKEGERPIFHRPVLKGIYASEGWFMKLMERNKQFVVKNPRKAHLFYMPFSSRMLEYTLYVPNSHSRKNLVDYLKSYADMIAAKYPFWNRTGGADHFLVACHDWAPYETRHHMERCVKALCNADVTAGFKIGRDVSLPETYIRSERNPLRDVGGKPPSERSILAFFAGSMHGYVRPILLQYWENKDPDMKIFGPMPRGVATKMNYIQHMKSSKYCICAKGYEVNSPRVVEAIFYECIPVIISDNFVPPFFEILDWEAFSVIVPEKDIPSLKEILLSIPEEKYITMQLRVKKVQKHFLWHSKPVKYDLFYMTLHSIWFNRVFQIKPR